MRARVFLPILVLLLVSLVIAAPNATISLVPQSLYETNNVPFNLTIDNLFKNSVIKEIRVSLPNMNATNVTDFSDWDYNNTGSQIVWDNGDIETNMVALFQFYAQASLVSQNTTSNISIITIDTDDEQTENIIPIIILNDDTSPVLQNNIPVDGQLLLEGINNQLTSIEANDPETGVKNVSFTYKNCSLNITNTTKTELLLNCVNGTCTNNVDLSQFEENETVCFEFISYNNALESSIVEGNVSFDGTAPTVSLILPLNGSYGTNSTIFSFIASDNLAPTMDCELIMENSVIDSVNVNNNVVTNTTYNLENVSEGSHDWNINCTDTVGLEGTSEIREIIVDLTAPNITLNSPSNGSFINDGVIIDISVVDNYDIDTVNYNSTLNSTEMAEGINLVEVVAVDDAGNSRTEVFTFIVDRTSPSLNVTTPIDNASSDVHVNFTFDLGDNLDSTLNCSIYVDGLVNYTDEYSLGLNNEIIQLPLGTYEWFMECIDDASNSVASENRSINVTDMTGPDIVSDIVYVSRNQDYAFDVNITDISNVSIVVITFDGNVLNITNNGDLYSGVISTDMSNALGNYSIIINATDSLGNPNSYTDVFELVNGYNVTLSVTTPVNENELVTASGTITLDDGSSVSENYTTLTLPNTLVNVTLSSDVFEYNFTEGTDGSYNIVASITSSYGFTYTDTETLVVENPVFSGSSSSSSNSDGERRISDAVAYCGDDACNSHEDCSSCPADCGVCEVPDLGEDEEDESSSDNITIVEEDSRAPIGIGSGTSLFRKIMFSPTSWLLFLMLIGGLAFISSKRTKKIYVRR